jgi:acetyl esterase/lipase
MKRISYLSICVALFISSNINAGEREKIWPKGKMPDFQEHQIAAMTDEMGDDFDPDKNRTPYLEWYDTPSQETDNNCCMILISGGSYNKCCDGKLIRKWNKELTSLGFQCVNFVYRTPRPTGLPIYQTAWEDGQRAVRLVRSQAKKRGYDPEKIGVIAMSAGGHLGLLLATSSETQAYERTDKLDDVPCHINWAILNAPAYGTTDGEAGTPATRQGYGPDVTLSNVFKFDGHTCPMSLHHGGIDIYTPYTSTLVYRKLRTMNIPAELHLYPDKGHGAFGFERCVEFMKQMGYMGELEAEVALMDRYNEDNARARYFKQDVWPAGKMPDVQPEQCTPYIEWHIPAELKTKSVQIIFSGGGYNRNNPDGYEVTPVRRYLNEKGMAVVTLKYRTPRPVTVAKHTTAWQDLQRAIRLVRSQAAEYGLDPEKIGIMGGSAGGHLALMGTTSSRHQSYRPIDKIDKLPCNVQWGICLYPGYVLTDGLDCRNTTRGNDKSVVLAPDFSFDIDTAPMLLLHGDADVYSAMGSVQVWEKAQQIGVQSELHIYATRGHCFQKTASPGTGSYTFMDRIWEFLTVKGFNR